MTVSTKTLISTLIVFVVAALLVYAYINPTTIFQRQQEASSIVIEIPDKSIYVLETDVSNDEAPVPKVLTPPHPSASTQTFPSSHSPTASAPVNKSKTIIPDSWKHVKDTQEILDFVKKQCNKYDMGSGVVSKTRMMIIPKNWQEHKIMYASNPKSGSTSFKKWYGRIQGDSRDYSEMTGVHAMKKYGSVSEAWDYYKSTSSTPVTYEDFISHFFKIGFVRNPLTRLISGFRDKILRRTKEGLKFPMTDINPNLTKESSEAEKFAAFAEGVALGTIKNFHFTTQWSKQKICDFPYDLLAQTETTTQQIKIVQEATNTTEFEFPGSRADGGYDSVATVHLAHEFYDHVRPEVMDKLYEFYKWDFVLNGYTKLDNPNFPYLDFEQDFDKSFRTLYEQKEPTDFPPATDTSYNK